MRKKSRKHPLSFLTNVCSGGRSIRFYHNLLYCNPIVKYMVQCNLISKYSTNNGCIIHLETKSFFLSRVKLQRQKTEVDFPLPSNVLSCQMSYVIPPANSGSTLRSSTNYILIHYPNTSIVSFHFEVALGVLGAPIRCTKAQSIHPKAETHFSLLYLQSCSFGHYLKLGLENRLTSKWKALPSVSAPSSHQ